MANYATYITEITLHQPPPLSTEMEVSGAGNSMQLLHGQQLIASMRPGTIEFEAPGAPSYNTAIQLSKTYAGFQAHPYPNCFVCGPNRKFPDALCIYPGKTADGNMIAAPWRPDRLLADRNGNVKKEYIWSALDCPGGLVVLEESKMILLGRMTAEIRHPIKLDDKCVVIGWLKLTEGRKFFSGTAIYSENKGLCAVASAIWIDTK